MKLFRKPHTNLFIFLITVLSTVLHNIESDLRHVQPFPYTPLSLHRVRICLIQKRTSYGFLAWILDCHVQVPDVMRPNNFLSPLTKIEAEMLWNVKSAGRTSFVASTIVFLIRITWGFYI
jgi:hypothetical protein